VLGRGTGGPAYIWLTWIPVAGSAADAQGAGSHRPEAP